MALTGLALWLSNRYASYTTPLQWTDSTYNIIVEDTLEKLEVDNESEVATNVLHKVGVFVLLRQALRDCVFFLSKWSADGGNYDFGDMQSKIEKELMLAYADASSYLSSGDLTVDEGENRNPYRYSESRDELGNW